MKRLICIFLCCNITLCTAQATLTIGQPAPAFDPFCWITGDAVPLKVGRMYVIEFGATWCTPCAKAIPELSRLALNYPDIPIISTFVMERNASGNQQQPDYLARVQSYVRKKQDMIKYHVALDAPDRTLERDWLKSVGQNGIPAIFLIDSLGRIAAVSASVAEIEQAIISVRSGKSLNAAKPKVRSVAYDHDKLLLMDGNGGADSVFLFRSVLTAFDGKFIAPANNSHIQSYRFGPLDSIFNARKDRVQLIGASIAELYQLAYGDTLSNHVMSRNYRNEFPDTILLPHLRRSYGRQWHLPLVEASDATPFMVYHRNTANRFNYSLKVPAGSGTAKFLQASMQHDLDKYFGYRVTVEQRLMPYWSLTVRDQGLVRKNLLDASRSARPVINTDNDLFDFQHAEMRDIIALLGGYYGYPPSDYGRVPSAQQAAYIDETQITGPVNFVFNRDWTFTELKKYLDSIGLRLAQGRRTMNVVVIRDPAD